MEAYSDELRKIPVKFLITAGRTVQCKSLKNHGNVNHYLETQHKCQLDLKKYKITF